MKRDYKIAHFSKENERAIFREEWDSKQWLTADRIRTKNPSLAWRYLHEQDCVSALSIIKRGRIHTWENRRRKDKAIVGRIIILIAILLLLYPTIVC